MYRRPEAQSACIHPLTLRFAEPELNREFSIDYARRSVFPIRAMLLTILVVGLVLAHLARTLLPEAYLAPGIGDLYGERSLLYSGFVFLMLLVVGFSLNHERLLRHQQLMVGTTLFVAFLEDMPVTTTIALPYGLAAVMLQVSGAYIMLRLRFWAATTIGLLVSFIHQTSVWCTQGLNNTNDPQLHTQFWINTAVLLTTNVLLGVAVYNIERSARWAWLQTREVKNRTLDLEKALQELKEAEVQLVDAERQASLGRMAAGIMHEINSPLGAMISSQDTLEKVLQRFEEFTRNHQDAAPKDAQRLLKSAKGAQQIIQAQHEGTSRIKEVMGSLKSFVSLDQANLQVFDLKEGLNDTFELLSGTLKGLDIERNLPEEPARVCGNPARINQAFANILENSVDALDGEGQVSIDLRKEQSSWHLELRDNGPGIPQNTLQTIFEPGFSKEGDRVKLSMGLPSAKRTVEAFGGSIEVDCPPHGGTVVHLILPAA